MTDAATVRTWHEDGFVVLPAFLPEAELAPAVAELRMLFPTASEFHDNVDPDRNARFADEFGGIDNFPFGSVELSLLAVHRELVGLAAALLSTDALRVYSIEAWAKYTGAVNYDQHLHRDYLSQTLVVPSSDDRFQQVEMFLYLNNVPPELGPPSFVSRRFTRGRPAIPNWLPREDAVGLDQAHPSWVSQQGVPDLYELETSGAGPPGTVVAYANDTFHRGTALRVHRGARYTLHLNFRPAGVDWISRHSWQRHANTRRWHDFVGRATPEQLTLFGFPPPGHQYWTKETLAGTGERYPHLDLTPWRRRDR